MSNRTITLPELTYKALLEIAREQGLTPENWIAAQLSKEGVLPNAAPTEKRLLSELTGDLIGAIDSQAEPRYQYKKTPFGEQLAAKLSNRSLATRPTAIATVNWEGV